VQTVRLLLRAWIGAVELRADLARATVDGYVGAARRLRDRIGDVRLDRLDRRTLEGYRDGRIREGMTPRTVAKDLVVLGLAWRWGREVVGLDRELPRVAVRLPELVHRRTTADEATAAVEALDGPQRLHLALILATGCRVSEIGHLRRCDVEGRWITVTGKRRTRRIPLPLDVAAELAAWLDAHPGEPADPVLGYRGASAREMLWLRMRDAKITLTTRDLRRARVDALYRAGVDPSVAGALLGHSPDIALRHYRRAAEDELVEAIERAERPAEARTPAQRPAHRRRRIR
jgi:integrase